MVATKVDERIVIEVETGKSDAVKNVRNGLRSRFEKVIVAAVDRKAIMVLERQLSRAGLILPSRVELILCGQVPIGLGDALE